MKFQNLLFYNFSVKTAWRAWEAGDVSVSSPATVTAWGTGTVHSARLLSEAVCFSAAAVGRADTVHTVHVCKVNDFLVINNSDENLGVKFFFFPLSSLEYSLLVNANF